MPNLPIFFAVPGQTVPVQVSFMNANGQLADPDSIVLTITDPASVVTTYHFADPGSDPDEIVKDAVGKYHFRFTVPDGAAAGMWNVMWVGAGAAVANGAQVTPSAFRLFDVAGAAGRDVAYCSIEELKSSISVAQGDTKDDYEMQAACLAATATIHQLCGQVFYQTVEARTFSYESIYEMFVDPFIAGSITEFALDYNGNGVYDAIWTEGQDFQALRYNERYNTRWKGEERPHDFIRVLLASENGLPAPAGDGFLPFVWAYTPNDRVKITATWGWKQVPNAISRATLLLAVDLFKMKDTPWGIAGTGETGMVKVQSNPQIMELVADYREVRNIVGV